jgi:ABC-type Na+ efflux pump permease subunit
LSGKYYVTATPYQGNYANTWQSISAVPPAHRLSDSDTRTALLAMTIIEFAIILLIVTNAAASTVTREKEDGTLDLLLSTPITSRYYIWGKLRGLVSFVLPLIAVPVLSAFVFIFYDIFHLIRNSSDASFKWIVFPEGVLILPGMLVIVVAFASILGMQMSLRCRTTVRAVMSSVGIMLGVCGALGWCGLEFLQNHGMGLAGWVAGSFSPFTLLTMLINPWSFLDASNPNPDDITTARWFVFIFTWIAVGAYTAVVWTMYKSMVKNFDMTIRKQSR